MRIVIDGAAGSGKSTFLGTKNITGIPTITDDGYTVFAELIRSSLDKGTKLGICPPQSYDDWSVLFSIMFDKAKEQHDAGCGDQIYWYDRGMPFISVFANAHNVSITEQMYSEFKNYLYDYVFIFMPIDSFDLSNNPKGKLKNITLEDRYVEFERTCRIYQALGHTVHVVPVFSDNLTENFQMRLEYIKSIIPELDIRGHYA